MSDTNIKECCEDSSPKKESGEKFSLEHNGKTHEIGDAYEFRDTLKQLTKLGYKEFKITYA